jgi:ATP-binding cassette, subfamily B, bacterial
MASSISLKHKIKFALRFDRAVRFVWEAGPGWTIANTALVLVQGILPLLALYLMKLIVDAVTFALTASDKTAAFQSVALLIGIAVCVALFNALLKMVSDLVRETQGAKVTDHIFDLIHAKSVEIDLSYYENPRYFDTLHRAQMEGPYRPTQIVNGLVQLGQNGISLVAMAGLLFSFHWTVAAILFAAALPGVWVRLKFSDKLYEWQRNRTKAERWSTYYNWMLTGQPHAKEIRLFGLGNLFRQRFGGLRETLREERLNINRKRGLADFGAQSLATLLVFGSFGLIAYRTVQGIITLGDMVMYFQAFQRGLGYLQGFLGSLASLYEDNLFVSNFYEFIDLKPKVRRPANPLPVPRPMKSGFVMDGVDFTYPESRRKVLSGIHLTVSPGEVVALVGENGSGKTTLIKLLCRLYDPSAGIVTLDGIDLHRFDVDALRREISVIFQDYVQYHLTAGENIWFGNIELPKDSEQIVSAAQHAGADEMIRRLPDGYETILGKWFEDGEELSIGQWQRMALARAFLRNSQLIVLDEPTSSLDVKTEYEVFKKFRKLVADRSAILISHRFSTVRMADRIFVLDRGKILESGTHEELMKYNGKYAGLFEKQASFYR